MRPTSRSRIDEEEVARRVTTTSTPVTTAVVGLQDRNRSCDRIRELEFELNTA